MTELVTPIPIAATSCPWDGVRSLGGPPNVKWCEETLCAWAAEPANTWSNLAYFVVALILWRMARREPGQTLQFFAPAVFLVGLGSIVYHASVAFVTQVGDFAGMYVFFMLLVVLNGVRLGVVSAPSTFAWLWSLVALFTVLTVVVAKATAFPVQGIIGILILVVLLTEALASRREGGTTAHGQLFAGLALMAIAGVFSGADVSRTWCDPTGHFWQGHAIWHVFSALGMIPTYLHYRQFRHQFV